MEPREKQPLSLTDQSVKWVQHRLTRFHMTYLFNLEPVGRMTRELYKEYCKDIILKRKISSLSACHLILFLSEALKALYPHDFELPPSPSQDVDQ